MATMSATPSSHTANVCLPKSKSQRDWALCMEISMCFMEALFETAACLSCGDIIGASTSRKAVFRSWFIAAVACRAGHTQKPPSIPQIKTSASKATCVSLCKTCDKDYVLRVVRGDIKCCRDGCRQNLMVSKAAMQGALRDRPVLMEAFFDLLDEYDSYECVIHADTVQFDSPSSSRHTLMDGCNHERNACDKCLETMCNTAIKSGRLSELACPDTECRKPFTRELIRRLVSKDHLRLYDKKLAFVAMAKNERFRWCRCGHGQIHDAGNPSPEWRCISCKVRYCFICRTEDEDVIVSPTTGAGEAPRCDHLRKLDRERDIKIVLEGRNRDEHLAEERRRAINVADRIIYAKRENTEGTKVIIALISKKCPRLGCRVPLERIGGGCAHMTCVHCQTEFCWSCKVMWKVGAFGTAAASTVSPLHLTTCSLAQQYHSSKTTTKADLAGKDSYAVGWDEDAGYDKANDRDLWFAVGHV